MLDGFEYRYEDILVDLLQGWFDSEYVARSTLQYVPCETCL